jgi:hypothetical protein
LILQNSFHDARIVTTHPSARIIAVTPEGTHSRWIRDKKYCEEILEKTLLPILETSANSAFGYRTEAVPHNASRPEKATSIIARQREHLGATGAVHSVKMMFCL